MATCWTMTSNSDHVNLNEINVKLKCDTQLLWPEVALFYVFATFTFGFLFDIVTVRDTSIATGINIRFFV
jgi:hypothetical protein